MKYGNRLSACAYAAATLALALLIIAIIAKRQDRRQIDDLKMQLADQKAACEAFKGSALMWKACFEAVAFKIEELTGKPIPGYNNPFRKSGLIKKVDPDPGIFSTNVPAVDPFYVK